MFDALITTDQSLRYQQNPLFTAAVVGPVRPENWDQGRRY
jgi:hypothetical protein